MRCDSSAQVLGRGNGPRVVDARSLVVLAVVGGSGLGDALLETVSGRRSTSAVLDHLGDFALGAGILYCAIVAAPSTVVALHEAWVTDAIVGSGRADTAVGLLDNDCENEAGVDAG